MSQEEIDQALDALEEEHGIEEKKEDPKPEDSPPGYLTHEEWIAKGKDPADYKGKNAYNAEYDRIKEIRELKDSFKQVVTTTQQWKTQQEVLTRQQVDEARENALADLKQATDDDDVPAALAAQKKVDKLETKVTPQVNPVISTFTAKNPIVDTSSPQFDQDFFNDMSMMHNSMIDRLTGGNPERQGQLTQDQIERSMTLAFKQTKELHPDKFKSPKNNRQGSPSAQKKSSNNPASSKLSAYKGNSRNPRDSNPANDIYEMLKKSDPKAAEKFAENLTGD